MADGAKFKQIAAVIIHQKSTCQKKPETNSKNFPKPINSSMCLRSSSNNGKDSSFTCPLCSATRTRHIQLHEHIATHHGKIMISCPHCDATSYSLWKTNVCKTCKLFSIKLNEHEASHYRDKTGKWAIFECSHCYRSFNDFHNLKMHIGTHKKRVIKQFNCQVCEEVFPSRHKRDYHLTAHFHSYLKDIRNIIQNSDNIQNHQCPLCLSVLSNLRTLQIHIIYQHAIKKLHDKNNKKKISSRDKKELIVKAELDDNYSNSESTNEVSSELKLSLNGANGCHFTKLES